VTVVDSGGGLLARPDLLLIAKCLAGTTDRQLPGTVAAPAPRGTADLALQPGVWAVIAVEQGYWSEQQELSLDAEAAATIKVWRAGTLAGRIAASRSVAPERVDAVFRPTELLPSAEGPSGESTCHVQGRDFRCELPIGVHDVELHAAGAMTAYLRAVRVGLGKPADAGVLEFPVGSSLAGKVLAANGDPVRGAEVRLVSADGAPIQGVPSAPVTATTDALGFFQLGPATPGAFLARGRHEDAASADYAVSLVPGRETRLPFPMTLREAARLDVTIVPPRAPSGDPWSIDLFEIAASQPLPIVRGKTASDAGQWSHRVGAPATYFLGVRDSRTQWHEERIDLGRPGAANVTIEVPTARAYGVVLRGGTPANGSLVLRNSRLKVRMVFQLDSSGSFSGHVPAAAVDDVEGWSGVLESERPAVRQEIPTLAIHVDPTGSLRIDVELSGIELSGRVLGPAGEPWDDQVVVNMQSQERIELPIQAALDEGERGKFTLPGLLPGRYRLWATTGSLESTRVDVTVTKEKTPGPVTLTLRDRSNVRGRVVTENGAPVAGASLIVFPADSPVGFVELLRSASDGTFTAALPPETRSVVVRAQASGLAYRFFRASIDRTREMEVRLERVGGTLRLRSSDSLDSEPPVHVVTDGAFDEPSSLRDWARRNGVGSGENEASLIVPQLAAGLYAVCRATVGEATLMLAGALPVERCVRGELLPGGELELEVPAASDRPANAAAR
jgi:hypothetical protein